MKKRLLRVAACACLACLLGCSDSGDHANPVLPSWMAMPHVSSAYWTDNSGQKVGILGGGTPSGTLVPYPNPSNHSTGVPFAVSDSSRYRVWVVAAVGPGESEAEVASRRLGADGLSIAGRELMHHEGSLPHGQHTVLISEFDSRGNRWPEGYYRVYVATERTLEWGDILVSYSPYYYPPYRD